MARSASDPKVYALYALDYTSWRGFWDCYVYPGAHIIGIVLGAEIILQPILFHIIPAIPKDPPYYIISICEVRAGVRVKKAARRGAALHFFGWGEG